MRYFKRAELNVAAEEIQANFSELQQALTQSVFEKELEVFKVIAYALLLRQLAYMNELSIFMTIQRICYQMLTSN
jgi:hypothetical protein